MIQGGSFTTQPFMPPCPHCGRCPGCGQPKPAPTPFVPTPYPYHPGGLAPNTTPYLPWPGGFIC